MTKEQMINHLRMMRSGVKRAIKYIENLKELSEEDKEDIEIYKDQLEAFNMAMELLEQQPSDDVMAIHTQGLDEGIRCAMCTNSMKSDRGCDGGCRVDEDMYKKVMDTIKNQMFSQPTSDDCVSRQSILEELNRLGRHAFKDDTDYDCLFDFVDRLPPVMPTHGTCKDCKHWKDSDGVYRRGIGAESKCPINNSRVFEGTFYCADFEKRGAEND